MTQAIIFDCFGVLTSDGWSPFKRKYFHGDSDLEEQATDLSKELNAGLLDYDTFVRRIADMADVPTAEARVAMHHNVPDDDLLSYIRDVLKPSYRIGMLSNAGTDMLHDLFTPDQVRLFDAVALSCDTGLLKPDRRAFEHIAEQLGIETESCIFIDDQERYVAAAQGAGMQAIWYRDFESLRGELEPMLETA